MKKKKRAHIAFPLLLFVLSIGMLVMANMYKYGRPQQLKKIVEEADDKLAAGDIEEARSVYEAVLDEDPNNSAACEGMMQLAFDTGDRELLVESYDRWLDIQIATGNTSDKRIDIFSGIINDMERRTNLNGIAELIAEGDYASAQGALQDLAAAGNSEDADKAQAAVLLYLARKDMALRNFDRVVEYLDKAVSIAPDDKNAAQLLQKAQEERLKSALEAHNTAAAEEIASAAAIEGYADAIKEEKQRVESFRTAAEKITEAFGNEDTDALYQLLSDEELKAGARELREPYIIQGQVSGSGSMAFYSVDNKLYVYYGTIKEGKREGDGRWASIASDGKLVIYSLNWKSDLPEGEGSCDRYSAPSDPEQEEADAIHEHDEFTTHGGVMDGKYSMKTTVTREYPYEYSVEYEIKDGFSKRIEPGEYPDIIDLYTAYPAPLAGWTEAEVYDDVWKKEYTTTIWFNWTPSRWVVDGIEAGVIPANG